MVKKIRFKGTIQNKEYVLTTTENQTHMEAVFELANQQLDAIKVQSQELSETDAMTLLAINALSEQLKMASEREQS
ncbi:cell division protein ZapA [Weissella diestrammenae]|uniref:Cell division protein ZapA n=1 Tax=Weissella diestrammenae TaxID=1162633 RepID=A0A7G9T5Z2_9LACO|nr:cell division protein ZapA [Weissella diestrammenae]MCM0582351.1 cell division protein ZapA [Weissella diestrammenae]QNN75517.1 cell division protein ZapA [Weissella diestrammenae]